MAAAAITCLRDIFAEKSTRKDITMDKDLEDSYDSDDSEETREQKHMELTELSENSSSESDSEMLLSTEKKEHTSLQLADNETVCDAEDAERTAIRKELSTMSFEDLQKLKEKLGAKVYNEAMFGTTNVKKVDFKRANKNRPREMSSKVHVSAHREVVPVKKPTIRDPRFDSLCGDFKEHAWKSNYSFLNDMRLQERDELKKELKSETDPGRKQKIRFVIQRMENQLREEKRHKKMEEKKQQEVKERIEMLKQGKTPYYPKKSEKRMTELVNKYEELKQTGKLKKHLQKYRKRQMGKINRKLTS